MLTCRSCGRENATDARFCSACGSPLDREARTREERKVVTCLFCDLVGFTARAESMDPEDVRRLLQPYHTLVRGELERFGGTVEKFIGDAVMAVFGAPVAHEDDPERAVRAALAIREALDEDGELEVRIGITTGEALIALAARPESGEGMASGDVVNTAARLQTAAAPGSILVDETTYRATERTVDYRQDEPVVAKGKTNPVPTWDALRATARVGVERSGGAALVGRERELTLLRETFLRVTREQDPQLLTLVGVPGIGKSRLVFELFQMIETGDFGLVFWRHGRSLPYGEGVTFWALSEMVKAQAGILETDTPHDAVLKLGESVARVVAQADDAAWVERHLRPLAGLEADEAWTSDRRGEAFAAWRRFFEALAHARPLVLAFEDLHWADEQLLDFVDYLVEWARGVPILVLCTARPELLARRSGWGGGKVNSSTILLSALSESEMTQLVSSLLEKSALPGDSKARLLEHAAGNPLYAEEFTRLLATGRAPSELPETVQGIIAARLDTLPREEKELLQDAAVIGRVFWLGALGGERWTLEERLHSLERKEFVGRERRSTVDGEVEYAFRHVLVRDVAYEQIPKADRGAKHRSAASWIESLGRPEDYAETVAYHYVAALDYARSTGEDIGPQAERARAALRDAGDRALALNAFDQAAHFYARVVELSSGEVPDEVLLRYGRALAVSGDERAVPVLEQVLDALLGEGNTEAAAEAHAFLAEAFQYQGRRDAAYEHSERAGELLRDAPASPAKARVLTESSRLLALAEGRDTIRVGEQAYEMALELGLDELASRALANIGLAKMQALDSEGGIAALEQGLELARSVRSPEEARARHNLGSATFFQGDLARARDNFREAAALGERFGIPQLALASRSVLCVALYCTGAWDEALKSANDLIAQLEGGGASYFEYHLRTTRARIDLARGLDDRLVLPDARRAVEVARSVKDLQALLPMLSALAFVAMELGELEEAREAAREASSLIADALPVNIHRTLELAWYADALGCADAVRRLAYRAPGDYAWRRVVVAILDLDFERAADIFASIGHIDEGYARLRAAERLVEAGRSAEAENQLHTVLAIYRLVGATRYLRRADELLARAAPTGSRGAPAPARSPRRAT